MGINILIFIISLAAIYHACTFAAFLRQNGNIPGARGVCAVVLLAMALLTISVKKYIINIYFNSF